MIDKKFPKQLDYMKYTKQDKCHNASNPLPCYSKKNNQGNNHDFKFTNVTQERKNSVDSPSNIVLQANSHVKIKLGKEIFVD